MISSFFKPGKKNKKFNYTPRYYNPKEDERRRKRMKFRRVRRSRRSQPIMVLAFAIALFFVIWLIMKLNQV